MLFQNAAKIVLENSAEAGRYDFSDRSFEVFYADSTEFILSEEDKGQTNKTFLMHVFRAGSGEYFNLSIKAYDNHNALIAQKVVTNVNVRRNQKTTLTGNLFGSGTSTFNIAVNPVWDNPGPPIVFSEKQ